ncbi:MAG: hypothetical protein EOO73_14975 [Myxococcales bacterium]|nr:MAG: hypothetical protein EOO73_14975 [Myxococcales bacterium]
MRNVTRGLWALMLGSTLSLTAGGCGKLDSGGEGSETHWLLTCDSDEDCGVGQCLCGVCTLPCASLRDCPAPLDQCATSTPGGDVCGQALCGSSEAKTSTQALSVGEPYPTHRYPTCEHGRQTSLTNIDVGFRKDGPPPWDPARVVVPDHPSGFLLFGGETGMFYRVASNGDFVRELAPPTPGRPDLRFDDAEALDDGSVLLSGREHDAAWVGKVDASWHLLWERKIETPTAIETQVAALPDGGAAVLTFTGTREVADDHDVWEATDIHWARISSAEETLWQQQAPMRALGSSLPRALAVSGVLINIGVPQADGFYLSTLSLDGRELSRLTAAPGTQLSAIKALPNDELAVLRQDGLLLLDEMAHVVLEQSLSDELFIGSDLGFDAARNELLVVGETADVGNGGFIGAVDMTGRAVWRMRREPWPPGPNDLSEANRYGGALDSVAVDRDGNAVAMGAFPSLWLSMTWVGAEACGG